jgi:hypothetical protein
MSVLDDDLLTADRPIPLGRVDAVPAAARGGPPERCVPSDPAEPAQRPADDHPLAALRGFRFEVVAGGAAVALVGRRPAVGRFLAAYLLVIAVVAALIAGFLLLAAGWRTTT